MREQLRKLSAERPHHDRNPSPPRSPALGQIKELGITELMINAVRLLDRRPRSRLSKGGCVGMSAGSDDDQRAVEGADARQSLQLGLGILGSHCAQAIRI